MKNDALRRLPPPPLFTIRPPPKPPGSLFEKFQTVEILNGQCVRSSFDILSSPRILQKYEQPINWLNIFLLILAVISVICCIIIAIFIFICLKKLKKEEKQYKNYMMSDSLSLKHRHHHLDTCTRTSEHYKCTSNTFNCCDDYYSHQLIPMISTSTHQMVKSTDVSEPASIENVVNGEEISQNHQYECIPEYLLTMSRHHHHHPPPPIVCHHSHQLYHQTNSTCGAPYSNFSRLYLTPQEVTTTNASDSSQCTCSPPPSASIAQEESSTPLLDAIISKESHKREETSSPKSLMIGWTRRNSSSTTKRKSTEQRRSFLSQFRKSSIL